MVKALIDLNAFDPITPEVSMHITDLLICINATSDLFLNSLAAEHSPKTPTR
jgi:hypothetical protein